MRESLQCAMVGNNEAMAMCGGFQKVLHEGGSLGLQDGTINHVVEKCVGLAEKGFKDLGILAIFQTQVSKSWLLHSIYKNFTCTTTTILGKTIFKIVPTKTILVKTVLNLSVFTQLIYENITDSFFKTNLIESTLFQRRKRLLLQQWQFAKNSFAGHFFIF